jgi:hypothetical protein
MRLLAIVGLMASSTRYEPFGEGGGQVRGRGLRGEV